MSTKGLTKMMCCMKYSIWLLFNFHLVIIQLWIHKENQREIPAYSQEAKIMSTFGLAGLILFCSLNLTDLLQSTSKNKTILFCSQSKFEKPWKQKT